jgi:hypothetical protein
MSERSTPGTLPSTCHPDGSQLLAWIADRKDQHERLLQLEDAEEGASATHLRMAFPLNLPPLRLRPPPWPKQNLLESP